MRDKSAAFSHATEALLQLGIPEILPALRDANVNVERFILGGSHSVVTYPPLNALRPATNGHVSDVQYRNQTNLYVHIAFCETQCSFCHYDVETYRGKKNDQQVRITKVARYLFALRGELTMWGKRLRASHTSISSIYIGGGTPLVLEDHELVSLIWFIRGEFHVLPNAEICVEGSPLTVMADNGLKKLQYLKDVGVTRFSFGVQSFNDEVLRRAARGYKHELAIEACKRVSKVFKNWNLDLIQSLYMGTPDEVWENLQVLRVLRPPHITWYHGRFANRPQGQWLLDEDKASNFEHEQDTLFGRMLLWEELKAMGYYQIDGNRFVLGERYIDPFKKVRTSVDNDLLGVGASSYSHAHGLFFRNLSGEAYVKHVEAGSVPVGRSFSLTPAEYLAASYVVGLRTSRIVEAEEKHATRLLLPELSQHYDELTARLLNLGLLTQFETEEGENLRLTELGRLFEDEVLCLYYSPAVQKALR